MGGVTHSLDSGIHYTLFHHTFDLLDRERKNSAKISPLEGVADVMFKRGTGFISSIITGWYIFYHKKHSEENLFM